MEFEMARAPQPENEALLPTDRSVLDGMLARDEISFKQGLKALHSQMYRPTGYGTVSFPESPEVVIPDDWTAREADHQLLATYLDLEPGPVSLASLAEASRDSTFPEATRVGQTRVINAIYSIFGPYHAIGKWFSIPNQIYVPICSVICLDKPARTGITCEITYTSSSSKTSTVKVKISGAGFGGARSKTVTVSSIYPVSKGSQQVSAPANLEARLYMNPQTGEKVHRIRIKSIGNPSHIDDFSGNFVVPEVGNWDRGDFGSSVGAGTTTTFDVSRNRRFDATVPLVIQSMPIDLGYTVSQSDNLTLKATATVRGIFDMHSVKNTAYALKFQLKN